MEKWVVYVFPKNKKIQVTQYHTEAEDMLSAIKNMVEASKELYKEEFKVAGVGNYTKHTEDKFINDKFF